MTAPDVVFVSPAGDLYDATAAGWSPTRDVHPLAGVCGPALRPLVHAEGCWVTPWPALADICACTQAIRDERANARRRH